MENSKILSAQCAVRIAQAHCYKKGLMKHPLNRFKFQRTDCTFNIKIHQRITQLSTNLRADEMHLRENPVSTRTGKAIRGPRRSWWWSRLSSWFFQWRVYLKQKTKHWNHREFIKLYFPTSTCTCTPRMSWAWAFVTFSIVQIHLRNWF